MINLIDELRSIDEALGNSTRFASDLAYQYTIDSLLANIKKVEDAWYGEWYGYLTSVYCYNFDSPTLGMYKSLERGSETNPNWQSLGDSGWRRYSDAQVDCAIENGIERRDIRKAFDHTLQWVDCFKDKKTDVIGIIRIARVNHGSIFDPLADLVERLMIPSPAESVESVKREVMETSHPGAAQHALRIPPHVRYHAKVMWSMDSASTVRELRKLIRRSIAQIERVEAIKSLPLVTGKKVFVGHGRSLLWHELKGYLQDVLGLQCKEFNLTPSEGNTIPEQLTQLLDSVDFALLIMTAEDEQADGTMRARQNVVHETGLFQGRLGFDKAIVLLEERCEKFSNNSGLIHLPFPAGNIEATFSKLRKLLSARGLCSP